MMRILRPAWALAILLGGVLLFAMACAGSTPTGEGLPAAGDYRMLTHPPPATAVLTPAADDEGPASVAEPAAGDGPSAVDGPSAGDGPASAGGPAATAELPEPYDSNRTMYRISQGLGHPVDETLAALAEVERHDDKSQATVILEGLKFFRLDAARGAIETLRVLTGEDFDFDRRRWREWVGARREEYAPPSDYPRWKVDSLNWIDPAIAEILEPGIARSRVDLTEVLWGGVRLDGIPPLERPRHIPAERATWLRAEDRVFGVAINGERRAYPLRVMNAHELANDVLGGEPISLVY